jgi:hypothetical protein
VKNHDFSYQPEPTDAQLATPAQSAMREVVQALPEESLSMAWRSGLNERLIAEGARHQRRRRFFWMLRPAAGLAMAGALAAVFMIRTSSVPDVTPNTGGSDSFEAALLSAHNEASQFADVAGSGVRPMEAAYASRDHAPDDLGWSEVDIESL